MGQKKTETGELPELHEREHPPVQIIDDFQSVLVRVLAVPLVRQARKHD